MWRGADRWVREVWVAEAMVGRRRGVVVRVIDSVVGWRWRLICDKRANME